MSCTGVQQPLFVSGSSCRKPLCCINPHLLTRKAGRKGTKDKLFVKRSDQAQITIYLFAPGQTQFTYGTAM